MMLICLGRIIKCQRWLAAVIIIWATFSSQFVMARAEAGSANHVNLIIVRVDDFNFPTDSFGIGIEVMLPNVSGVTGVNVTSGDGSVVTLIEEYPGEWGDKVGFANFGVLQAFLDGAWTIDILGASPSTTTFTFDASAMVDGDFPVTSNVLNPLDGTSGVAPDVIFSWTDPSAGGADILVVNANGPSNAQEQEDNSLDGGLTVSDTAWDPLQNLLSGSNTFSVRYFTFDTAGLIGSFNITSGAITWGLSQFAPVGYPASTPLMVTGTQTVIGFVVDGPSNNYVDFSLKRIDSAFHPGAEFQMFLNISVIDVSGVTGVTITSGDNTILSLVQSSPGQWKPAPGDGTFATFGTFQTFLDGGWTIEILGPSPSTSTFTLDASAVVDGDYFPTPTGVTPANSSVNVPANTTFTWNDPAAGTAGFIAVEAFGSLNQRDSSFNGTLSTTDTSWKPPLDMEPGPTSFGVVYLRFGPTVSANILTVTSGSVVWGKHPFAAPGDPDMTPFFTQGSETTHTFTVADPCPADTSGDGSVNVTDLLELLGAWGANPGHPADINDDGQLSVTDLLALIAAWRP